MLVIAVSLSGRHLIAQSPSGAFNPALKASAGKKAASRYNSAEFFPWPSLQSSGVITPRSSVAPSHCIDRWRRPESCRIHPHPSSRCTSRCAGWQPSVLSHKTTSDFPAGQGDGRDSAYPSSLWAVSPPHSEKPTSCSISQQMSQRALLQRAASNTLQSHQDTDGWVFPRCK